MCCFRRCRRRRGKRERLPSEGEESQQLEGDSLEYEDGVCERVSQFSFFLQTLFSLSSAVAFVRCVRDKEEESARQKSASSPVALERVSRSGDGDKIERRRVSFFLSRQ